MSQALLAVLEEERRNVMEGERTLLNVLEGDKRSGSE
jgi:hypothetical protein